MQVRFFSQLLHCTSLWRVCRVLCQSSPWCLAPDGMCCIVLHCFCVALHVFMHVSFLNCCVQFSCTVSVMCMPGCYVNRHRASLMWITADGMYCIVSFHNFTLLRTIRCTVSVACVPGCCLPGCYVNRHRDGSQQMNVHIWSVSTQPWWWQWSAQSAQSAHVGGRIETWQFAS
jgi:hypothetical protein